MEHGRLPDKLKIAFKQTYSETIPGLQNAEFCAPRRPAPKQLPKQPPLLLDEQLRLKKQPKIRFAGQITGVEGYVESAAIGLLAGRFSAAQANAQEITTPPSETAFGALLNHITGGHLVTDLGEGRRSFQPMNVNFGLFPPIEIPKGENGKRLKGKEKGRAKKKAITTRALNSVTDWLNAQTQAAAE